MFSIFLSLALFLSAIPNHGKERAHYSSKRNFIHASEQSAGDLPTYRQYDDDDSLREGGKNVRLALTTLQGAIMCWLCGPHKIFAYFVLFYIFLRVFASTCLTNQRRSNGELYFLFNDGR